MPHRFLANDIPGLIRGRARVVRSILVARSLTWDSGTDLKLCFLPFAGMAKKNRNVTIREEFLDLPAQEETMMPFAELKIPKARNFVDYSFCRFACARCGRSYRRKDSLQRHKTWECGKEPQFKCPYCPQRCKRKAHWQRHVRRQHQDQIDVEKYLNSYSPKIEID